MITLLQLWEHMQGGSNTHQNGFIKPDRNLKTWGNECSIELFNDLRAEFEKSQIISDWMMPFLVTKNVVVPRLSGQMHDLIVLPGDYEYFASARSYRRAGEWCGCAGVDTISGKDGQEPAECPYMDEDEIQAAKDAVDDKKCEIIIKKVPNMKWGAICNRKTLKPSVETGRAYCTQYDKGLKLIPKSMGVVVLDYFRKPKTATFNYTILNAGAEDEYLQYNATTSQALEWSEKALPELVARIQIKYGTAIGNQALVNQGLASKKI